MKVHKCAACGVVVPPKHGYRVVVQAFDRTESMWSANAMICNQSNIYCSTWCAQTTCTQTIQKHFDSLLKKQLSNKIK